jgi:hypothetical protein
MKDRGEIFSAEVPIPEVMKPKSPSKIEKPKRKYTRRQHLTPDPDVVSQPDPKPEVPATLTRTLGLEYVEALTRLLELISPPQRDKLIDFIIQEKIT